MSDYSKDKNIIQIELLYKLILKNTILKADLEHLKISLDRFGVVKKQISSVE